MWHTNVRICSDHWKYLILVDFTILTFADPPQPLGDANVKINPLGGPSILLDAQFWSGAVRTGRPEL
jgi:hypothetical protein